MICNNCGVHGSIPKQEYRCRYCGCVNYGRAGRSIDEIRSRRYDDEDSRLSVIYEEADKGLR